jgi:hypothetical protein
MNNFPRTWLAGLSVIFAIVIFRTGRVVAAEAPKQFRAGAATSNITPPLGVSINGGMQDRPALHVHDELHARCLVLDDGKTKLVIAVNDSCMIPREIFDEAKRLASERTEIPEQNMLCSATHTHSAPTAGAVFQSEPDKAKNPARMESREEIYARETVQMNDYPAQVPVIVQAMRIGDLAITAIPCEVFVEIGLELKKRSPIKPTFTIELANGYDGYLPTPAQHQLGGYETRRAKSSYLEVGASDKITAKLLELLGQLAAQP